MIEPNILQPNYIPLEIEDINIPQGMDVSATPQSNTPVLPATQLNITPSPNGSVVALGTIQSTNFNAGSSGWRLDSNGNIEANDGNFRGDITGASGTFSGTITASAGTIGSWTLSALAIYHDGAADANSAGMAPADYPFYAGKKYADRATAPFRVTPAGALVTSNITITGIQAGSSLDMQYALANSVGSAAANLALQSWTMNCAFSSTDLNTVSWGAGTLTLADGTAYNISAGNTGNMSARTYIYLDIASSTTVLQTTTTPATAVGNGKKLIATAVNDTAAAIFQVFGGVGGLFINGNVIAANSIVANQINVTSLSALAADLGTITAGNITLDTSGHIKGGQTAYNTGTGFWEGYDTDAYKKSIGNPDGDYFLWDGTNMILSGGAIIRHRLIAGEALTANDAVYVSATDTASDTIVQDTQDNESGNCAATNAAANTFIATGVKVVNAQIYGYRTGAASGNVTVEIQETTGGEPNGVILGSKALGASTLGPLNNWGWSTFTFATPISVKIGTTYAMVVWGTTAGSPTINLGGNSAGGYASGSLWNSNDTQGTWSETAGEDMTFKINERTEAAGYVYKADATADADEANNFIGFAVENTTGGLLTEIQLQFTDSESGLTPGAIYYLSDTPGAIASSAGTYEKKIGLALTATELLINFTI